MALKVTAALFVIMVGWLCLTAISVRDIWPFTLVWGVAIAVTWLTPIDEESDL